MDVPEKITIERNSDVICSLELALALTQQSFLAPATSLKWILLGCHSAIQGALCCHLNGSANIGALKRDSAKEFLKRWDEGDIGDDWPEEWMAPPVVLFKRVSGEIPAIEAAGNSIPQIKEYQQEFERLTSDRNDLIHFQTGAMLFLDGVKHTKHALWLAGKIIQLVFDEGYAFRHLEDAEKKELRNLLNQLAGFKA